MTTTVSPGNSGVWWDFLADSPPEHPHHHRSFFIAGSGMAMIPLIKREFRAVILWSILSCVLRLAVSALSLLASLRQQVNSCTTHDDCSDSNALFLDAIALTGTGEATSTLLREVILAISVLAGWVESVFPSKVARNAAPGFLFASPWILLFVRARLGVLPNLPVRICETVLGRLTPRELAILLPVHFVGAILGTGILRFIAPSSMMSYAIDPIIYSPGNPWIVDFFRETIINGAFTVALLVLPVLLKLNGLPVVLFSTLLMYPLFAYQVDFAGTASTFAPEINYALRCVTSQEEIPLISSHMIGPLVGGFLGGKVMQVCFPDDA